MQQTWDCHTDQSGLLIRLCYSDVQYFNFIPSRACYMFVGKCSIAHIDMHVQCLSLHKHMCRKMPIRSIKRKLFYFPGGNIFRALRRIAFICKALHIIVLFSKSRSMAPDKVGHLMLGYTNGNFYSSLNTAFYSLQVSAAAFTNKCLLSLQGPTYNWLLTLRSAGNIRL